MRKQSQIGSSKYEFNPEQFEIDIHNKIIKHQQQKLEIYNIIMNMLKKDPSEIDQTFSTILQVLREIKQEYNL
jgi:hypothetical protein